MTGRSEVNAAPPGRIVAGPCGVVQALRVRRWDPVSDAHDPARRDPVRRFHLLAVPRGLWLSFHHWDGFSPPTWAGLANYARLFGDGIFRGALGNNMIFVVGWWC